MAERIFNPARSISVELICHGALDLGPSVYSFAERGVHVLDIEKHSYGRPTNCPRTLSSRFGRFVREHHDRISDPDFSMANLSIWFRHAHEFLRTENLFVEFDGSGCVINNQVRSHVVIAIRDRFRFVRH
jgi:hypothetical protein